MREYPGHIMIASKLSTLTLALQREASGAPGSKLSQRKGINSPRPVQVAGGGVREGRLAGWLMAWAGWLAGQLASNLKIVEIFQNHLQSISNQLKSLQIFTWI